MLRLRFKQFSHPKEKKERRSEGDRQELLQCLVFVRLILLFSFLDIGIVEDLTVYETVDDILDTSHVLVALLERTLLLVGQGEEAEEIEAHAVGHYHVTRHEAALPLIVMLLIEGIFAAQVLVEADAQGVVSHDDALVEGPHLCVALRYLDAGQFLFQSSEGLGKFLVDIVHIAILASHVHQHTLECRVFEELQQAGIDFSIVHLADAQHILDEHTRLHGIVGIHLLECGVVACGQVKTLDTVVALDGDLHLVLSTIRLQLPFATDAKHHDEEQ